MKSGVRSRREVGKEVEGRKPVLRRGDRPSSPTGGSEDQGDFQCGPMLFCPEPPLYTPVRDKPKLHKGSFESTTLYYRSHYHNSPPLIRYS